MKDHHSPEQAAASRPKKLRPISQRKQQADGAVIATAGARLRLVDIDPSRKPSVSREKGEAQVETLRERLLALQQALYAENQRSLLIVLQAMDTGGKDGAIKNICHGLDPNGVYLTNFKYPSAEEWAHDFLWRVHRAAPRKGIIGIWNRSHYEDVLVPRVHKQITNEVWRARCEDINAFERLLARNGATILKFFLHISKDEQKERLEARLRDATKLWKFNPEDLKARALWENYQLAYEAVLNECSTPHAPWHVVPANRKWARNLTMLETIVGTLERMKVKYPVPTFDPKTIVVE